ncbi:hypothetical protein [Azospirillum rugosum]|uniref:Helix-turn-helix domain-containing protein n=1 Tax=Azospirillum rugosum TaxID=416170 RepID=A0ABS4SSL6_9PROT|nr:hypothetical protein [Azospirillum rugosum]MBP2295554.1 hypothetical protein [Azospirillum rugosum]MDQ0528433.1 hypothetical protein [Azospirillum rugosum]
MHSKSRGQSAEQLRRHKRDAISRIRRAADQHGLDAGDIARMTGVAPGHARAILSGFGDTVPQAALDRTALGLPD